MSAKLQKNIHKGHKAHEIYVFLVSFVSFVDKKHYLCTRIRNKS